MGSDRAVMLPDRKGVDIGAHKRSEMVEEHGLVGKRKVCGVEKSKLRLGIGKPVV